MKALQLTFLLLICFSFCNFAFTQEKLIALKFDEFNIIPDRNVSFYEATSTRLKRFARELKRQPRMQALIIGYERRIKPKNKFHTGDESIFAL